MLLLLLLPLFMLTMETKKATCHTVCKMLKFSYVSTGVNTRIMRGCLSHETTQEGEHKTADEMFAGRFQHAAEPQHPVQVIQAWREMQHCRA
jgi:hypothetical protein